MDRIATEQSRRNSRTRDGWDGEIIHSEEGRAGVTAVAVGGDPKEHLLAPGGTVPGELQRSWLADDRGFRSAQPAQGRGALGSRWYGVGPVDPAGNLEGVPDSELGM